MRYRVHLTQFGRNYFDHCDVINKCDQSQIDLMWLWDKKYAADEGQFILS